MEGAGPGVGHRIEESARRGPVTNYGVLSEIADFTQNLALGTD